MTGVHKPDLDTVADPDLFVVFTGYKEIQHALGVLHGIQRLHLGFPRPPGLAVLPLRLTHLDVGAVL